MISRGVRLSNQKAFSVDVFPIGANERVRREWPRATFPIKAVVYFKPFSSSLPLFDEAFGSDQLVTTQELLLVGLLEHSLCVNISGACDLNGNADGDLAGLDRAQQPMLAIVKQSKNAFDIFDGEVSFSSDRAVVVSALFQTLDVVEQIDCAMLSAG